MNNKVGIERCQSYNPDEVYKALKRAVELAGDLHVAGKKVLLKPNILFDAAPEKHICTHPVFLEAAIRLVKEMGAAHIFVGDSPGVQTPGFSGKVSGLGEVTRKNGAEWVDFTKDKIEFPCPEGKLVKSFTLTRAARDADVIISVPKLKTHQLMYFTGAIKNIFGLIPSVAKSTFHVRFPAREALAAMIVDLNLAVKPAYTFFDAVIGMEGPGPAAGSPRNTGLVLASSNILAVDLAASAIIAYPPLELPINKDALGRGCWFSGVSGKDVLTMIEYPGLSPEDVRLPDYVKVSFKKSSSQLLDFILPQPLRKLRDSFASGPEINHAVCIRCGDCLRICGSKIMSLTGDEKERRVIIDYPRCIRCFCCHEICPVNAIDIKQRPQNRRNI